jgi:hypothetical protein
MLNRLAGIAKQLRCRLAVLSFSFKGKSPQGETNFRIVRTEQDGEFLRYFVEPKD